MPATQPRRIPGNVDGATGTGSTDRTATDSTSAGNATLTDGGGADYGGPSAEPDQNPI